nr:restriction endonuclease [Clostridium aestuarii]
MDPRQFELFTTKLFTKLGYRAKVTQASNDGGKDVILKKHHQTYYVECKRYAPSNCIGRPKLQKLVGAAVADGIPMYNTIFITTSYFSEGAKKYAKKVNMQLYDLQGILKLANTLSSYKLKVHNKQLQTTICIILKYDAICVILNNLNNYFLL